MANRIKFYAVATPIIWLIVVAPLAVLFAWWTSSNTLVTLAWSILLAPIISIWIFLSFQTENLKIKWPATNLIGLTTVLLNVVFFSSPLLLFFPSTTIAALATLLWIAISCYAIRTAQNVKNTRFSITSSKLNSSYRLMHLSDIHAGSRSMAFVDKVVSQTIAQLPDAVFITGDLLDSSAVDTNYLQSLARFSCPVFLCLGNHERYVDLQGAIDAIQANNVQILRSDTAILNEIEIIGIDDADNSEQVARELPSIARSADKFQVLLYHRPQGFEAAADNGVDLMLAGHTHAGQMWPFGLLVKRQFPFIKGRYQHNGSTLYVSQGTGTWGPIMRLGTISEMTLIEVSPA